jgi:hypothetical protein
MDPDVSKMTTLYGQDDRQLRNHQDGSCLNNQRLDLIDKFVEFESA